MISLTKKGVQNYKEVILRCLKYIKIMQNKDLNRRYYEEVKALSQLAFDYKPKSSPISATKTYASRLMDFDPKDAIVATYYSEINEDLIKKYLNMLQLDNLNIYFLTNLFEKECTLTEKYFGTKYTKEKITITEDEINAYKCEHIFDYSPINEFIPKNFDILPPPEKIFIYPEKIKSQKNMDVWFLRDTIFKIPKLI
jgi:secreted Zn-dependent insulinase-like peptidase